MNSHQGSSRSPGNPTNFLLIIPYDMTPSSGILLPKMFAKKHGKDMLEKVSLKVPNGEVWQVDLKKSKGDIWLKNGWWEFVKHYDMKISYLVMFEYEGFSRFSVVIFDPSALEIEYPKNFINDDATKGSVSSDDEVESVELDDDDDDDETWLSDSEDEDYDEGKCSRKIKEIMEMAKRGIKLEKAKADFECDNPDFMVYMHKSYFTKNGLVVPCNFQKELLRGRKSSKCALQLEKDGKRKTWEVIMRDANLGNADWLMFLKDNGITVGDVIAFKLINKHLNVLGVTIFRSDR